jgi:acetyl esterase/lipase
MARSAQGISRSIFTIHHGIPDARAVRNARPVEVTVTRDVRYTPQDWPQPLDADLHVPAGAGPFPAILMVHGGGWIGGQRQDMQRTARAVARRGYVVMNVSYRFAPHWRFPSQLQDMQQALLWLRAHADRFRVQLDRIASWGYSAGAHLALLAAVVRAGHKYFVAGAEVQAVVAGGTPVDLSYYPRGPLPNSLMGVGCSQDPQAWRDASPVTHVAPGCPPVFLYHGSGDLLVGQNNAHAMYAALQANQVPAELYLMRGLGHIPTFFLPPIRRGGEFLDHHLACD